MRVEGNQLIQSGRCRGDVDHPCTLHRSTSKPTKAPYRGRSVVPRTGQFFAPFEDLLEVGARAEETRANARAYLMGLLAPGDRASTEPLAQRSGISADRLQNFITYFPWDWTLVQVRLIERMVSEFASEEGILSLDDTEPTFRTCEMRNA